jgi:hypothetical protein
LSCALALADTTVAAIIAKAAAVDFLILLI